MCQHLTISLTLLAAFAQAVTLVWYDSDRCEGNWGTACTGITINDNTCCTSFSYLIAPGHYSSHNTVKVATGGEDTILAEDTVPRLWDADDNSPCAYEVEVEHENGLVVPTNGDQKEWCYYGVINGMRQPVSGVAVRWNSGNMLNDTESERPVTVRMPDAVFLEHESNYYFISVENEEKLEAWKQIVGDNSKMVDFMLENHDFIESKGY